MISGYAKMRGLASPLIFLYRDIKNRPAVFSSFYIFYEIFTKLGQPGPLRAGLLPGTFTLGPSQKAPESFDFSNLSGAFKLFFDYSSSIPESCFLVVTGTASQFGEVYFPLRPLCVFDYNENCCQNDVTASGRPLRVECLDLFNRELRILCHDFIRHTICQHRAGELNRLFTLAFFSHFFKSSAHNCHSHLHNS